MTSRRHLSATDARQSRRRHNLFSVILPAVAFTATAGGTTWVKSDVTRPAGTKNISFAR